MTYEFDHERLHRERIRLGLTQTTLADRAGVSRETLRRVVNGTVPRADTAKALADALDLDVFDLWIPTGAAA
jgi:transcriptional regulator with XRE-family HTH domain